MTRPVLPDLLAPGLKLVFCGTAPSRASAAASAYYARPGNRFWPTLHAVGLTPRRFLPAEYPQLLALGIGLTDLAKHHSGNDDELPEDAFDVDALKKKLKRFAPAMVAFTSKNAAQAWFGRPVNYGLQEERLGATRFFVLTSPSGQAVRFWDIACWRELARAAGWREGWAESSKLIAAAGDDALAWPEFGNEADKDIKW